MKPLAVIPALLLISWGASISPPIQSKGESVFREDFEHYDKSNWDDFGQDPSALKIVDGGYLGGKCLQITATTDKNTGGHLYKKIDPGLDSCYLRFYVKFEKDHGYVHHFVHLVGYNPPTRWPQGGAGERPDGDKRFSTGVEPWGYWGKQKAPGVWHFYTYWHEMKKSPDGKYWGNFFDPEKPVLIVTDRWICVEIMVAMNSSPDKADGKEALWIDGALAGEWKGYRWRSDPALKVNGLWILYYMTDSANKQNNVKTPPSPASRVWFDDIVLSRSPIGPLKEK